MNNSYLLIGIKTVRFLSMIFRNGGFSIRYLPRVFLIFNASIWSHVFAMKDKRVFRKRINEINDTQSPVFIIGNWRTGTTFLHQLLSIDDKFVTPSVYQVSAPDHFLVSRKYYYPVMSKMIGSKRPMDNVKIGFDEPQEDEYALLKICKNTPLEDLLFPKSSDFFLAKYEDYLPDNDKEFIRVFQRFYKKLLLQSGKQVLFKNPFHSMRISLLKNMFPNAKFIHIYRNPEKVVPSTIRMWDIVGNQNVLKRGWKTPTVEAVAKVYKRILVHIKKESQNLEKNAFVEVQFEAFEQNPITHIRSMYETLELEFTVDYENKLKDYIDELKDYKKNTYEIDSHTRETIREELIDILPMYY